EVVASQRGPRNTTPAASPPPSPVEPVTSPMPVIAEATPPPPTAVYPTYTPPATTHPTPPSQPAMQVAPTTPPPSSGGQQRDWSPIVTELQAMAEDALGNRARKVKDILGAADPSEAGIEGAIDQIPSISLLFVDSSRLELLAHEMRARLKSYL
ncbi:MAG TPA: hypothetical protein VFD88_11470, partial [Clostridia bacterium]|nr:hypothetical protein [Clostridia bacterium]